ncbi:MAG TPA: hypothetical protein VL651_13425 [Bacteroidia bacterium]|jgi:hypothetical protein|nr:hypothetical protein [Bacteroidia bacterium]
MDFYVKVSGTEDHALTYIIQSTDVDSPAWSMDEGTWKKECE